MQLRGALKRDAEPNTVDDVGIEGLHALWAALAIGFGCFAGINAVRLPGPAALPVATFNIILAIGFLALWLGRSRLPITPRRSDPLIAGSLVLASANVLTTFARVGEPLQNSFVAILLIAAGSFLLSFRWLIGTVVAMFCAWAPVAWRVSSASGELVQFSLTLVAATILAGAILAARVRTHRRLAIALAELRSTLVELRASEKRYRRLFGQSRDMIGISTPEGRLLDINQAGLELLGYSSKEEILGDDVATRAYADPADRQPMVDELLAKGYVKDYQSRLKTRSGRVITVEGTTSVGRSEDGREVDVLAILRDVTQRNRQQAELQRHREHLEDMVASRTAKLAEQISARQRVEEEKLRMELQFQKTQKLESLGLLASGIAHDFNNLLVGIMGGASLIRGELPPDSPYRAHVEKIATAATRAAELANQMLAFAGKSQLVFEACDLRQLVEEMAQLLETSMSKKATLTFSFEDDLPAVEGDVTQIRQVVMNLLINASDALGTDSGSIAVRIGTARGEEIDPARAQQPGVELSAEKYLVLEVADTGCGMDLATRERIFEPFYTTKHEGRGLGMAAVLGIVRAHGGLIQVDSQPGAGSTFKVFLPSSQERPPRRSPGSRVLQPAAASRPAGGTILVVDDEEVVRYIAQICLQNEGFDVLSVEDGRRAVDLLSRDAIAVDLVLLDFCMPNLDGEETFHELRRLRPDLKVILTSGAQEQNATQGLMSAGLAGFVSKPYPPEALVQKVTEVLGQ